MVVKVDQEKCVGCEMCENLCPEGFEMNEGKAQVKDEDAACVEEALSSCPVEAITKE
ncbi:MAG: ferredoxin [Candidatus Altiarchaeota archaeon]|nr:ferredoxin [Candidatus Altiarchaeota archaeon]